MSPWSIALILVLYFVMLIVISMVRSRKSNTDTFYLGNRSAPWYLVAIGMIGASISGVTFISVPGWVGSTQWGYMQTVLGYMLGYLAIALVLLPLYYRMGLTSIYGYLEQRFGFWSYKTGAAYFILSRVIGASFRLFLVANVLELAIFQPLGLPYWLAVGVTIALIFTYTFKSGMGTIIYTDVLQTIFLLLAVVLSIGYLIHALDISWLSLPAYIAGRPESQIFHFEFNSNNYFWKQFLGGAFIALCMTGLDQDMMQKNLSVSRVGLSQRSIYTQMVLFLAVNLIFMSLGVLLYAYVAQQGLLLPDKSDELFPLVALKHAPAFVAVCFVLGLTAAAYSSADSALTSLTTSFCIDFLNFEKGKQNVKTRTMVHIGFALLLYLVILVFKELNNGAVINELFKAAGLTYGPLLGLFAFGILTKRRVLDSWIPFVCIAAPIISFILNQNSELWFNGYKIGFELLPINGFLTFAGLWLFSKASTTINSQKIIQS